MLRGLGGWEPFCNFRMGTGCQIDQGMIIDWNFSASLISQLNLWERAKTGEELKVEFSSPTGQCTEYIGARRAAHRRKSWEPHAPLTPHLVLRVSSGLLLRCILSIKLVTLKCFSSELCQSFQPTVESEEGVQETPRCITD